MMAKGRKPKYTEAEIAKMRDIDAYEHGDKERTNNPPVGMAHRDKEAEKAKTYAFDPHLDPTLQWAGKEEGLSFEVPTSSIHIHESIKPHKIINSVVKKYSEALPGQSVGQTMMWEAETQADRFRRKREAIEFYQHGVDWTNRLIAGDSLVIMNSMLEKEGMAGQVQMVYIDPPYGIKYGSNFQPFVDKRDVKDKKDDDLDQTPEMITAFRDTWELGIHSYLTYLRSRVMLSRELLSQTGCVCVQISDENVHLIRNLCDEVFGPENFISQIVFRKTGSQASKTIGTIADYIVIYAKNAESLKMRKLYKRKSSPLEEMYERIIFPDGTARSLTNDEKANLLLVPKEGRFFKLHHFSRMGEMTTQIIVLNTMVMCTSPTRKVTGKPLWRDLLASRQKAE